MNKFLATASVGMILATSTVAMAQTNVPVQTPTSNMNKSEINVNGDRTTNPGTSNIAPQTTPNMVPTTPAPANPPVVNTPTAPVDNSPTIMPNSSGPVDNSPTIMPNSSGPVDNSPTVRRTSNSSSQVDASANSPSNNYSYNSNMDDSVNLEVDNNVVNSNEKINDANVSLNLSDSSKADSSIFERITNSFNSKDIEALVEDLSKDSFVYVTDKGEILTSKEAVKHHYINMLTGDKKATLKLSSDSIMNIAPGVAVAVAKANIMMEGMDNSVDSVVGLTLKFEDGSWKIASKQSTPLSSNITMMEHKHENGGLKMFMGLIIGGLLGFFGCRYTTHKHNAPMGPRV